MAVFAPSVLRGVPPATRKPVSPLAAAAAGSSPAPYTPADIAAAVSKATSALPAPLTDAQITARASGELSPLVKQVTDSIQGQASRAGQAITGYSNSLANSLRSVDYAAPYTQAESGQAAVDAALSQSLTGGGAQASQDLQSRLAQINEPGVVSAAGNAVAQTGTGNANTNLAAGSAALSALIANAASAKTYGAKLPGIAGELGLQGVGQAQGDALSQIADKTAALEGQLPGILNDLRSQSDTRASNRATLGQNVAGTYVSANSENAKTAAANNIAQVQAIISEGYDPATGQLTPKAQAQLAGALGYDPVTGKPTARTTIAASNANTAAARAAAAQQNADAATVRARIAAGTYANASAPKFNPAASKALGYRSDQFGNPLGGKITLLPGNAFNAKGDIVKAPAGAATTKTHGFTAPQVAKLKGTALTLMTNAANGFKDAKGNDHPAIGREAAILEAQKEGLPAWIYLPAANSIYVNQRLTPPGEIGGR